MPSVALKQTAQSNIYLAASDNDISAVTAYLDSGINVNELDSNGYSTLHAASSYNHFDLLQLLVSRGGNINLADNEGDTPLFVAETKEMCALLIELGADVNHRNQEGQTALEYMMEEDEFPDVVAFLQSLGGLVSGIRDGIGARYGVETVEEEQNLDGMDGLPEETRNKLADIMRKTAEDGIDRDEELRLILSEALVGREGLFDGGRQKME